MPEENERRRDHAKDCEHCKHQGLAGQDVFPYSVAKGVIAWLHRPCKKAYDAAKQVR